LARTLRGGFGPVVNHAPSYNLPSPYTIGGSEGAYYIQAISPGAYALPMEQNAADFTGVPVWEVGQFKAINSAIDASVLFGICYRWQYTDTDGDGLYHCIGLRGIGQANGRYKVALTQNDGTADAISSSDYASSDLLTIRREWNGTTCILEINGLVEATFTTANRPTNGRVLLWVVTGDVGTGLTKRWSNWATATGASGADRPGATAESFRLDPNGNVVDGWVGVYTDWDDFVAGGTPDDGTTICYAAQGIATEVSALTTASPTGVVGGVYVIMRTRMNVANKGATLYAVIQQSGANQVLKLMDTIDNTEWRGVRGLINTAPGGSWDIPNLEAGAKRFPAGDAANLEVTALCVELIALTDDPAAAAADRRRLLAAG